MVLWFEAKKQRICGLPQNTLLAKRMTSPPLKTMSSAEQSPEPRESEAAQALSQLQTQQPDHSLVVAPAEDSSVPPSPHVSLAHHSDSLHRSLPSANSSIFSPALPAPGDDHPRWLGPSIIGPQSQELPSRSAKRTASPIGLRSTKSRRDGQGSQQPFDVPTSSTGAQPTPAPYQHASNRAPSRARARALASAGSRALPDPREPQAERRLAGRPRKNPPDQAYPGPFTGAPLHYGAGGAMMPPHPFHNTFKASTPSDLRSAGSLDYREQVGASIPNDPSLATQRSSLSQPQGFPSFAANRTGLSRPPPGSSTPHGPSAHLLPSGSSIYTPWSPNNPPSSSGSFSLPYGSPGVPIPPPPYQILPMPNSSRPQAPVKHSSATRAPDQSSSVEADGYMMIREAIPVALVREVVAIIGRGLPVNMRSETAYTYATPVQAYRVRDEFVKVCSLRKEPSSPPKY